MSLEYAPRGLVGMLTPQANTTVEPELNLLWPAGVAMINARLLSDKDTMSARLVDYFANYGGSLRQFANAPVGVVAAACTGASYLAGREREASVAAELSARGGCPFITAAMAVVDALGALKANRIGLVSPYPDDLNGASVAYWRSHGLDVVEVASVFDAESVFNAESAFHPIYSLAGSSAMLALCALEDKPLDAIVMLGTGMPTLAPIAAAVGWSGPPVMSCNLCLAWRAVVALDRQEPRASTLAPWLRGEGWVDRLNASRAT
jgi:maleate cis-trans isomerase